MEVSSEIVCGAMVEIIGGSFTSLTNKTNPASVSPPFASITEMVMKAVPTSLVKGRTVTVRFAPVPLNTMSESSTSSGFDDEPIKVRLPAGVSTSPIVNVTLIGISSSANLSSKSPVIVGRSLTELICTVKVRVVRLLDACPSSTVTVMTTEPVALAAGT